MKIRALVLALALALPAAPAAASAAAAAPSRAAAVTVLTVGPVRLMRLMRRGWWCERVAPGRFRCSNAVINPYLNVVALDRGELWQLLRTDYECTGGGADVGFTWDCTPD